MTDFVAPHLSLGIYEAIPRVAAVRFGVQALACADTVQPEG